MRPLALVFAVLAGTLASGAAWGHATLLSSIPADGAVVKSAPAELVLTFNEPVGPLLVQLAGPIGATFKLAHVSLDGNALVVSGLPPLGEGTHALSYRVVSADGHPVGGSVVFSIGRPTGDRPALAPETDPIVRDLILIAKYLIYMGLFVGIGGRFFEIWVARQTLPPSAARTIMATMLVGFVATIASVGLQGLDALALPVGALFGANVWVAGFGTTYGFTVILLLASFVVAIPGGAQAPSRWVAQLRVLAALTGAGFALAASGHAATADPRWLARPAVFVHVVGVGFWVGSLIPLGAFLRTGGRPASEALARFSRAIPFAVVPLVLAGLLLALLQFDNFDELSSTNYGIVFTAKMIAVVALLVTATFNRFVFTPDISAGNGTASRQLRRAIAGEVIIVAVIFALVASWRFTPPPRALAAEDRTPVLVHIHTEKAMSDVSITPGRAGPVRILAALLTGDFQALDAQGVTIALSDPAAGIQPFSREARRQPDGRWLVDDVIIPTGGRWNVSTEILIDDFTKVVLDGQIDLRP